jgi:YcaO-like protein with predicted kinase domain
MESRVPGSAAAASDPLLPGDDAPGVKRFLAGTHRALHPRETLERVRGFMPAMQITRIATITGLDRIGIPVAVAYRPNSRSLAVSQGKGITVDSAKASAVMETIELFHAETIELPLRDVTQEQLQGECRVIENEGLSVSADAVFTPRTRTLWIEGYDLLQREAVSLPYELVHTRFTLPFPPGSGFFQANSNGLASGNELLEAVSQAICEVVERDALALWHLSSADVRDRARVRLDSIDDADCLDVLAQYRRAEFDVTVWDMTTDVGIPAFRCMIAERQHEGMHVGYTAQGMGCHPSKAVALLRSMTEAAQSRLTYIAGSRDDVFRDMYARLRDPDWRRRRQRQLRPGEGLRDYRAVPDRNFATFHGDVTWELQQLQSVGVRRVVAVVLTKPEFGIPVVKVVIPGLEGYVFTEHYRPGARARRLQEAQA